MRNIEEIAAEEDLRLRDQARRRLKTFLLVTGTAAQIWGWFLFQGGEMGKGALVLLLSLMALGWVAGIFRFFQIRFTGVLLGLLGALPPLLLYERTRLPGFYWGSDPAFWLSAHAGSVGEPPWSPLATLLVQAAGFLFPQRQFTLPPALPGAVFSLALFFFVHEMFRALKNRTAPFLLLLPATAWLIGVTLPFWNAATLASGLTAALGLLFFLFLKFLLERGEKTWSGIGFLSGLLWSLHPLWGLLGLLNFLAVPEAGKGKWGKSLVPFLTGLSPFLWILLRADRVFPSWGGPHPFAEALRNGKVLLGALPDPAGEALSAFGWAAALLGAGVLGLTLLNLFKWKTGNKPLFPTVDFWSWLLAAGGAFFFFSPNTGMLGPCAPLVTLGLGEMFLRLFERGMDRRQAAHFSGPKLAAAAGFCFLSAFGLLWLPGQSRLRDHFYFPQRHAFNLLQTLSTAAAEKPAGKKEDPAERGKAVKTVLVCDDDFEAQACFETRRMEPLALSALILDKKYLGQKWYLTQLIRQDPELLFSVLTEFPDEAVKGLLDNNLLAWVFHWSVDRLPPGWRGPAGTPTVLTREFGGRAPQEASLEAVQFRLDLSALPRSNEAMDAPTRRYFSRYVSGFNELGKDLMGRGFYLASIHAFDRSLKLDPGFSEPQSLLSRMYSQQKILEAAQLEFEKTIKTHPGRLKQLMGDLEAAQKAKNEARSVVLLDEMIRLNAELADAQYQLSVIFGREGRADESKALLESSVQLNPKQMEAQLTMGRMMAGMGNRLKAEEAFRAVLGINPENKEAQVELWKLLNK